MKKNKFSSNYHMVSMVGKFEKRILIERNLGNQCLMIWGRSLEREVVVKFTAWLILQWCIGESEIQEAAQGLE